jgi:hypothetical protein
MSSISGFISRETSQEEEGVVFISISFHLKRGGEDEEEVGFTPISTFNREREQFRCSLISCFISRETMSERMKRTPFQYSYIPIFISAETADGCK